jgi:hypothetical protein
MIFNVKTKILMQHTGTFKGRKHGFLLDEKFDQITLNHKCLFKEGIN